MDTESAATPVHQSNVKLTNELTRISHLRQIDNECFLRESCAQRMFDTDSLAGWQTPSTQPKLVTSRKKRNKRVEINTWTGQKSAVLYSDGSWDDSVEKYSYRYIPNNRCYQAIKCQPSQSRSNFTQRKPISPSPGVVYSTEHKNLQRSLTKDLRREFQSLLDTNRTYFRLGESPSNSDEDPEPMSSDGPGDSDMLNMAAKRDIDRKEAKRDIDRKVSEASVEQGEKDKNATRSEITRRALETQSAQPVVGRLEDLLINKRCSTNLEKSRSESGDLSLVLRDRNSNERQAQTRTLPIPQYTARLQSVNTNELQALAKKTFVSRKQSSETRTKRLKPIEKITPSLREAYDNARAADEMMKLGCAIRPLHTDIEICPVLQIGHSFEINHDRTAPQFFKHKALSPVKNPSGTASHLKVAKLGESRPQYPTFHDINDDNSGNFQTFLPSISGKRITTKLASLR